ncbi:MAG: tellurite resistance protein TerB [Rhodospirillaceae bacterium]|nr:tellurite resistance protein TerB [Rhodospirillaceae bacterium]
MPNRRARRPLAQWTEFKADHLGQRDQELLEAVITAAALVARADGWVDDQELSHLLDFIRREGLLSSFDRGSILRGFDDRLRQIEGAGGAAAVVESFRSVAGWSRASLVVDAAECVAVADGYIHPGELQALTLIRLALQSRSWPGDRDASFFVTR